MNMGNARLLQEDTEGLPTDITESITAVINYYYGVIDFVDS